MAGVRATDIPFTRQLPKWAVDHRVFRERGEQRYSLELLPVGITFEVDRLRRERHELVGELLVTLQGTFPMARTVDGVLTVGDFSFSSVHMRQSRSKLLAERSGVGAEIDWFGHLEEFCVKTINAERMGQPAVALNDLELPPDIKAEVWDIDGWPVLRDMPMVLFGDGGSGKSYLALWTAGLLASRGINVLYADWEFSQGEHRKRLGELFQPMPKGIFYARCDSPLSYQTDRLSKLIRQHECQYIICDSIGFAVDGPAESQDAARTYFKALRQLAVGSMNIAHIPKQYDDSREAQIFGSRFFHYGARSTWFVEKTTENPPNELRFGLHHRKSNVGRLLAPRGYKLVFGRGRTTIEPIDIRTVEELAAQLPLLERVKRHLAKGALSPKTLSEDLNTTQGAIRSLLSRHGSILIRVGQKVGLKQTTEGLEF